LPYDVFICHSTKDKLIADAACAALEARRISCWIAPRDILPSVEWGEAIVNAILECKVVVLIFSLNANESADVRREINLSIGEQKVLVPFRIEDVQPTGSIKYAVSNRHWLDAINPPMERRLVELSEKISLLLNRQPQTDELWKTPPPPDEGEAELFQPGDDIERQSRANDERIAREAEEARLKELAERQRIEEAQQQAREAERRRIEEAQQQAREEERRRLEEAQQRALEEERRKFEEEQREAREAEARARQRTAELAEQEQAAQRAREVELKAQRDKEVHHTNDAAVRKMPREQGQIKSGMVLSILVTLFCCLPIGIFSIMKSNKINELLAKGDYDGARKAAHENKVLHIWAIIVGIIVIIIALMSGQH
jgi:flagellar biosynthesis GTPase FlhF